MTTITERIATFAAGLDPDTLPESVLQHAAVTLLDWCGAVLAGADSHSAGMVRGLKPVLGATPEAALVGTGERAGRLLATLFNGTAASVHEIDDVHQDTALHGSVTIAPAVLAAAELSGCSPRRLLSGLVAGYEAAVRVSRALGPSHYHYFHSTSTAGCFGAAAGAGHVMGLTAEALTRALGLAGAQAGGVWEEINRAAVMVKHFHGGRAAMAGLLAALLAQSGYPGAATVLEGERGLLPATSRSQPPDIAAALATLGSEYMISRNFFKRYPCCLAAVPGLDAMVQIQAQHRVAAADVAAVVLRVAPIAAWMVGNTSPPDVLAAKFSLPFGIAVLLRRGQLGLADYTQASLDDPAVRELMGRVRVEGDPEQPRHTALITVRTHSGACLEAMGTKRNLTHAQVVAKFRQVTGSLPGGPQCAQLADLVLEGPHMHTATPLFHALAETVVIRENRT